MSKIWWKNIHAFLRNCSFLVGAFYFDAPYTPTDLCSQMSSSVGELQSDLGVAGSSTQR